MEEGASILGEYTYNVLGQRVSKSAGGTTTLYLYDFEGNLLAETSGAGTITTEYLYRGRNRLAMVDSSTGAVSFFHTDQFGTPQLMTNEANTQIWQANHKPFGEADVNAASTVVNNFRFQGQYYDAETGYHYNYHRYYDPKTGRYLTPDPIGLAGWINPYVYSAGDPVNFSDPFGLFQSPEFLRYTVPGQVSFDYGMTALEKGNYGFASLHFAGMVGEQVLFALTLGQSSTVRAPVICDMNAAGSASKGKIGQIADSVSEWLGEGARVVKNDAGDYLFLSKDGTRRIRFDINRPYPHQSPHGHIEELVGSKWVKSGPIFPKDVLPW